MGVSGDTLVIDIETGSKKILQNVFVANIIDPMILGMGFMERRRVVPDVGQKGMQIGNVELILNTLNRKGSCRQTSCPDRRFPEPR